MTNTSHDDSDTTVIFDLSDPWVVAAVILFALIVTIGMYRSTRAICTVTIVDQ